MNPSLMSNSDTWRRMRLAVYRAIAMLGTGMAGS